MSRRPLLGVTCCVREVDGEARHSVIDRYVRAATEQTGAMAFLLPALPAMAQPEDVAARIDGLLLTGSPSNVQPHLYGATDAGQGPFDTARDAASLGLIPAMIAAGKPVFGICRGFQELNVAFGGTLIHIPQDTAFLNHHAPDDAPLDVMFGHAHAVTLSHDGLLRKACGQSEITVNTVHYQGVGVLGEGLRIEARASDGLIEAFSAIDTAAPVVGVQWHPEWDAGKTIGSSVFFDLLRQSLGL